jgi:excinuclease ABC subunit A
VKLGTQYCPDCEVPIEPQSPEVIAGAGFMKDYRGKQVTLLAPLVVNRKGVYTDLAKWAAGKGYWHLRVDGKMLPVRPFPRIDRFKEHTIELPVLSLKFEAKNETAMRNALRTALVIGKGCGAVLLRQRICQIYSIQARLPLVRPQLPGARPAPSSPTTPKHGNGAPQCYGTGLGDDGRRMERRASGCTGAEDNVLDSWIEVAGDRGRLPRRAGPPAPTRGACGAPGGK